MKETATAGTTTLFRNFRRAVISGPFQLALVAAAAEAAQQSGENHADQDQDHRDHAGRAHQVGLSCGERRSPSQSCLRASIPRPEPTPKFGSSSDLKVIEMAAELSSSGMK
jgi:hypothetical protein